MRYTWPFYNFTLGKSQRRGASRLWHTGLLLKLVCVSLLLSSVCLAESVTAPRIRPSCSQLLAPSEAAVSALQDLFNRHDLTVQQLIAIRDGENPLEKKRGVNARIFGDVVEAAIARLKQNSEAKRQLDQLIEQTREQARDEKVQTEETKSKFLQITFYDIEPGTFTMGSPGNEPNHRNNERQHKVEITKMFRMADMPVTQWQYAFVMRNNPSRFKTGDGSMTVVIDGEPISMRPNSPVERVTDQEEDEYLRRLNEWSQADDPRIYQILPNHVPYAHIRVETEAEFEFVLRNRGKWNGPYLDGVTEENLHEFAWFNQNSNMSTPPVGELRPIIVDGHKLFYDLIGNVWERVKDTYDKSYGLTEEQLNRVTKDPCFVTSADFSRVIRGGSWYFNAQFLRSAFRYNDNPGFNFYDVGFRLVEDKP